MDLSVRNRVRRIVINECYLIGLTESEINAGLKVADSLLENGEEPANSILAGVTKAENSQRDN